MTFNAREISLAGGQPIRLYLFERGIMTWGYCTADRDITYASVMYKSLFGGISDAGIRQSGESKADAFEITAAADLPVAQLYRGIGPSSAITVTVRDMHYGDTEAIIGYIGSIYSVNWPAEDRCKITCQNSEASLNQTGLRMTWGRGCQYVWADTNCGLNRDLYKTETTVQALTGTTITSAAFAALTDGWFQGGYVEWPIGNGQYEQRGIEKHVGTLLTLFGGCEGLGLGQSITVFPSCKHTLQSCGYDFANQLNYGGKPHQPGSSPFNGNPVF